MYPPSKWPYKTASNNEMFFYIITFEEFREDGGSFGSYKKDAESEKALANIISV